MVDAQFCIPYTVTMVLLGVHPGPAWYTEENLHDQEILNLSKKVKVEMDPVIDKAYFEEDKLSARVEITTEKGERLERFVGIPKGDPLNPLTRQEVEDKFRDQASYSLKDGEIEGVIQKIYDFEKLDDVSDLMSHLAGGSG
jgi:2-methylcitrate dehydratase